MILIILQSCSGNSSDDGLDELKFLKLKDNRSISNNLSFPSLNQSNGDERMSLELARTEIENGGHLIPRFNFKSNLGYNGLIGYHYWVNEKVCIDLIYDDGQEWLIMR